MNLVRYVQRYVIYCVFLCGVFVSFFSELLSVDEPHKPFPIRVLLESSDISAQPFEWVLTAQQGFIVEDAADPDFFEEIPTPQLILQMKNGYLMINGRRMRPERVSIRPQSGTTGYHKYHYSGTFLFMRTNEQVYLINSVDLEDYLFSVLRWEGWPGWPEEVNKVFAIMCRTYVVSKLLTARRLDQPYDIKKSNIHQTYNGVHGHEHLRGILHATRGIVMVHNGQVIEAMYDACCGGIVPGHITGYNFNAAPYLKRMQPCTACKNTKLYNWQAEYTLSEFQTIISEEYGKKIVVTDVKVSKMDKAGVVQEMLIKTKSGEYKLNGKRIYALFKKIKSLAFDVAKKGNKIIFKNGRGYGHHMGVCQWGVRQRVKEKTKNGHLHQDLHLEILKEYYVDISFMNIQIIQGAQQCQDIEPTVLEV